MISTDINLYKDNLEILSLTAEQIKKDFQVFNIQLIKEGEEVVFERLRGRLLSTVEVLLESSQHTFISLLYRIDLPERHLHELFENPGEIPVAEQLTDLIIKRELMKVVFRKYWGK